MTIPSVPMASEDTSSYRDQLSRAVASGDEAQVLTVRDAERESLHKELRADNARWMDQNERIASQRDDARRIVDQVTKSHEDFAEALGLSRDAYGDVIIAAAQRLRAELHELHEVALGGIDYTNGGIEAPACVEDYSTQRAVDSITEMHRLLALRAERLGDALARSRELRAETPEEAVEAIMNDDGGLDSDY